MRYWYKEQQDDVITKLNYWLICFNHIDSNIKKNQLFFVYRKDKLFSALRQVTEETTNESEGYD